MVVVAAGATAIFGAAVSARQDTVRVQRKAGRSAKGIWHFRHVSSCCLSLRIFSKVLYTYVQRSRLSLVRGNSTFF